MVCGFEKCLHLIIVLFTLLCIYEYSRRNRAEVGLLKMLISIYIQSE